MAICSAQLFKIGRGRRIPYTAVSMASLSACATPFVSSTLSSRFSRSRECHSSCCFKGVPVISNARVRISVMVRDTREKSRNHCLMDDAVATVDNEQVSDSPPKLLERDFNGTPYVPVYVMLPVSFLISLLWESFITS